MFLFIVYIDPIRNNSRQLLYDFSAEKYFISVSHVKHIKHPAQIGFSTNPPSVMRVGHEIVFYVDAFAFTKLFDLHSV